MVALELLIDASGMQRGAQQAAAALDQVSTKAAATDTNVKRLGSTMSSAFQATGGSIQVAQGVAQTAQAFSQLNIATAGFSSARTLLEIGKTAQDFRELRGAVGATGGVFSTLGAILRAHPLLTIASVISIAATAWSFFSTQTQQATEATKRQGEALDSLLSRMRELDIRRGYGAADPRGTVGGTVDALTALRLSGREDLSAADAAGLFGVSEEQFRLAAAQSGVGEEAMTFAPEDPRFARARSRFGIQGSRAYTMTAFSRSQAVAAGEFLLRQRQSSVGGETYGPPVAGSGSDADTQVARGAMLANREMDQLIVQAQQFGDYMGDAFYNAVSGAQSLRQVVASIVADFARMASRQAFSGLFGAVAGGMGRTGAQTDPIGPVRPDGSF